MEPRIASINRELVTPETFRAVCLNLGCSVIQCKSGEPLTEAFGDGYHLSTIYVDAEIRTALNREAVALDLISRQRSGMDLEENLRSTFAGQACFIYIYENDCICLVTADFRLGRELLAVAPTGTEIENLILDYAVSGQRRHPRPYTPPLEIEAAEPNPPAMSPEVAEVYAIEIGQK